MGLNDMNGRVQDAITGRFLSADPTTPDFSSTQNFNRYSYVKNNPLTYIDPTGFVDCLGSGYEACGYDDAPAVQAGFAALQVDFDDIVVQGKRIDFDFTRQFIEDMLQGFTFDPNDAVFERIFGNSFLKPVTTPKKAQSQNPCPGTGGDALAFRQSAPNDPSKGYTPTHDLSPGSFTVVAPDGTPFFAPPNADFVAVYQYGQSLQNSGGRDFGYYFAHNYGGLFDFQRGNNQFNAAYAYAANYAIGIDYAAAGDPLALAQAAATARKYLGSGGQGFVDAPAAIEQGYKTAKNGGCSR